MLLRIGLVDGYRQLGATADQSLAPLQASVVHRLLLEAFRREQFERSVLPLQVDRADLGHHQAGDLAHDLVEPGLLPTRPRP